MCPEADVPDLNVIVDWLKSAPGLTASEHHALFAKLLQPKPAAPLPAELPPDAADTVPALPAVDPARGRRGSRLFCQFGPFKINELMKRNADSLYVLSGLSIICARHQDMLDDRNECASDCNFGVANPLAQDDVVRRLKRWALKGYTVPTEGIAVPRTRHMKAMGPARHCSSMLTADERLAIPLGLFAEGELDGL